MAKTLRQRISDIMGELKALTKDGNNTFHRYKYATDAQIAETIRPLLNKHGLVLTPSCLSMTEREQVTAKGNKETLTTVLMSFSVSTVDGEDGEEIVSQFYGSGQDAGDKGIYKAMTGAQKYFFIKTFCLGSEDDAEKDDRRPDADDRPQSRRAAPTRTRFEPRGEKKEEEPETEEAPKENPFLYRLTIPGPQEGKALAFAAPKWLEAQVSKKAAFQDYPADYAAIKRCVLRPEMKAAALTALSKNVFAGEK